MKGPGQDFEDAFRASIPKGVYVRRLRTPTAMGFVVPQLVKLVTDLSRALGRPVPDMATKAARFRFTPKAGFDLLLTAPASTAPISFTSGQGWTVAVSPAIVFALELKSVEGASLPFSNVDSDQEKALVEAATAGHVACLLVEFRKTGEVWAVPIQVWMEIRLQASRASLPLADARRLGLRIHRDANRGTSRPYWDVRAFLEACGALVPNPSAVTTRRTSTKVQEPEKTASAAGAPSLFE